VCGVLGCLVQGVQVPVLLPGAKQPFVSLSPSLSDEDKQVVENVVKIGEALPISWHGTLARARAGLHLNLSHLSVTVANVTSSV
jgi:hypothetical protein